MLERADTSEVIGLNLARLHSTRFDHAEELMGYFGLVPSEDSTGDKRRQGGITKTGNGQCRRVLVEAAHHYRLGARVSATLRGRQEGQPQEVLTLSWKAQQRLCARYRHLVRQHKKPAVVVTAVARELAGFIWAIAKTVAGQPVPASTKQMAATKASGNAKGKTGKSKNKKGAQSSPAGSEEYVLDDAKHYPKAPATKPHPMRP